jgi:uncharacterized protein (TIGR03437 family)
LTDTQYEEIVDCEVSPAGDHDAFRFNGTAGAWIDVFVYRTGGSSDHCLELLDPDGVRLGGGCVNPYSRPTLNGGAFRLPKTGAYRINVSDGGDNETFKFALAVLPVFPSSARTQPIAYGVFQTGSVTFLDKQVYTFSGNSGDKISARAVRTKGGADHCVRLIEPDGTDATGARCVNPYSRPETTALEWQIRKSGPHYLEVVDSGSDESFSYNVWVDCVGPCLAGPRSVPTPSSCTYSLIPPTQLAPSSASEVNVGVLTQTGCFWDATSNSSYLSIKSGQNGWGSGTITVTVTGNTSPTTRNGSLTIAGQIATITQGGTTPLLVVTPTLLTFSYRDGAPAPGEQILSIYTSAVGQDYTVSTGNSPWLLVTPDKGKAPGSITVAVRTDGLIAGSYDGRITVNVPSASPTSRIVAVKLIVDSAGPPRLSVDNDSLSYSFALRSGARSQRLSIANLGGGTLDYTASATTQANGTWLTTTPATGSATPLAPGLVTITVDPASLPVGTYKGRISIAAADQRKDIPVTITVTAVEQTILLSQTGLTITAVKGGGAVPAQTFGVLNLGQDLMDWNVSATVLTGPDAWLKVSPESGTTDGYGLDVPLVSTAVDVSKLEPGQYAGLVKIEAPAADNTPQYVAVLLNVLPAGSDPGPLVRPTGVVFTELAGGAAAAGQKVRVATLSASRRTFSTGLLTSDGRGWLSVTPASGTVEPGKPVDLTVQVFGKELAAGVRRGVLTLLFQDGAVQTVNVLYVVAGAGGAKSAGHSAGACTPTRLLALPTSLQTNFVVPAGWPSLLESRVIDDCGDPLINGTVTATFSNGDPPLPLVSMRNGLWQGTWQVRSNSTALFTLKLTADAADRQLTGSAEVSGTAVASDATPMLGAGGVLNAATMEAAAPVAPGSMVAIMGQNLSYGRADSPGAPLETLLAGTRVTLGGKVLPLMTASEGQINALVPPDLKVNTRQQLVVVRGSSYSLPESVAISAVQPGIFTKDGSGQGQGLVYRADGKLAETGAAAKAGDIVTLYCTGLGATSPSVPAGSAAPASPEAKVVAEVKATIGGADAKVMSAALAVGKVGIYLVKATVPSGVAAGNDVPVILRVGGQTSPPVTMALE